MWEAAFLSLLSLDSESSDSDDEVSELEPDLDPDSESLSSELEPLLEFPESDPDPLALFSISLFMESLFSLLEEPAFGLLSLLNGPKRGLSKSAGSSIEGLLILTGA